MARLRLGFLGAILVVLAALSAQPRSVLPGANVVAWTAGEALPVPLPADAMASTFVECWDDQEESFLAPRQAVAPARPRASRRLKSNARADAPLARPQPRSTGPPGITRLA